MGAFHAQKLARFEGVELVAIIDPMADRRDALAAQCQTQSLDSHEPLLGRIDAAIVATPTSTHHAVASALLNWGIHLLVEKPLCVTATQADELVRAAQRNGAVLQVGHVERFNPAFAPAAALARNPSYIEATRTGPFTFRSTDIGVVLDLMIHDLDLVLSIVRSPVRRIDSFGFSVLGGHEDVAHARLEFESGCVAQFNASRVDDQSVRRMNLWSTEGSAAIDFAARKTILLCPSETLRRREFDVNALAAAETVDKQQALKTHLGREEIEFPSVDAISLELEDFLESIRAARAPRVNGQQGRDVVALAERILRKMQLHRWNRVAEKSPVPTALPNMPVIAPPHFQLNPHVSPVSRTDG